MSASSKTKTIGKAATTTHNAVQKSAAQAEPAKAMRQQTGNALSKKDQAQRKQPGAVQLKLAIGKSDDPLEHQADAMAFKVLNMSEAEVAQRSARKPNQPGAFLLRKQEGAPLKAKLQPKNDQEKNTQEKSSQERVSEGPFRQLPHELTEKKLRRKEEKPQAKEEEKVAKKEDLKKSGEEKIAKSEPKPQLRPLPPAAKTASPAIAPKGEEKPAKKEEQLKKSGEEKVKKAELKPQLSPLPAVAKTPAALPKEEKLAKKEDQLKKSSEEKVTKAEQKPQMTVLASKTATVSPKQEEKLAKKEDQLKKSSEEKVTKAEQKPQMTVLASKTATVSPKQEEKLAKKEDQLKKSSEEKVTKAEQKPQMTVLASKTATVSPKQEEKLAKKEEQLSKSTEEKVSKAEQKPQMTVLASKTATVSPKQEEKLSKKEEQLNKSGGEKLSKSEEKAQLSPVHLAGAAAAKEDPVQREAEQSGGESFASPEFEARLASTMGSGTPMEGGIKAFMDARFGVDFHLVRIHTDITAIMLCNEIGAQAFAYRNHIYFNRGKYNPDSAAGKFLLAHELTHVIQQGYAHPKGGNDVSFAAGTQVHAAEEKKPQAKTEEIKTQAEEKPQAKAEEIKTKGEEKPQASRSPRIQRLGWDTVNNAVRRALPVWTLLTVIMGYNPILGESVTRNTAAWFGGLLDLIPLVGPSINDKLRESGKLQQAADWFDSVFADLPSYNEIRNTWDRCWSEMGIVHGIDGNIAIFRRHFDPIINRIRTFANRVLNKVVELLRETLLRPLDNLVKGNSVWELVTTLIGSNPLTGEAKPRTATTVLRAVAALIPGGQEKFDQLVQSRALERAYQWFITETQARNLTWARVSNTFSEAWNSLSANDILHPIDTFNRMVNLFSPLFRDLGSFVLACLEKLLEFIFEAAMGAGGAQVLAVLKRAQSTFLTIIRDPVGFLGNLVRAVGQGIRQFGTNILTHLRDGVIAWLTGPIAAQGIQMPERWDIKGFIWFGLQILGLTWNKIRERMVRILGPRVVGALETGFEVVMEIREKGIIQALKDRVMQFFGGLKDLLLQKIKNFIIEKIVTAGIQQIVALLSPVGAVIDAIIKTYNTIMFFIDNIRRILDFVNSILESISNIASGNLAQAANYVERTMARTIPILLDFLARFLGLGNVATKVKQAIEAVQNWVGEKLDSVINWVKNQASRLIEAGRNAAGELLEWWRDRKTFRTERGETHTIFFRGEDANARLMIASVEMSVPDKITWLKSKTPGHPEEATLNQKIQAAEASHTKIDGLQKDYVRLKAAGYAAASNRESVSKQLTRENENLSKTFKFLFDKVGYDSAVFGPDVNLASGEEIESMGSNAQGMVVDSIRQFNNGELTFTAYVPPTKSPATVFKYADNGTRWKKAAKPIYRSFSISGNKRMVTVTKEYLTGVIPSQGQEPGTTPANFLTSKWTDRGHLVAQQFGGKNYSAGNIVPMTMNANQERGTPNMRRIEMPVAQDIMKNNSVFVYEVEPIGIATGYPYPSNAYPAPKNVVVTPKRIFPTTGTTTVPTSYTVNNE